MAADFEVVIAGAGISGSTLALALAREEVNTLLVDGLPASGRLLPERDGRAYALSLTSCRLLESVGLGKLLEEQAQEILSFQVCDGRPGEGAGPGVLGLDLAETGESRVWRMVEDWHLRRGLIQELANSGGKLKIAHARVSGHEVVEGRVAIWLDSDETISASLLVGCDGRSSRVASCADICRTEKTYGQSSIVCAVRHERPHEGVAHQLFMPNGPLAILPLQGNRSLIVWTEKSVNASRIAALDDAGFLAELRPRFGTFLGHVSIEGPRYVWPLMLSIADSLVADRVALVGDAAQTVHPLAGQGLNLALRDVAALAEVVVLARRRGEDIGRLDVLERYQRWRRFDSVSLALMIDGLNTLFSNDNQTLRLARGVGMQMINDIPFLKRMLSRESAGLTGCVPKLMLGLPI